MEILEGYRQRDDGEVSVLGHDPAHPNRARRSRIGIVLQTANDLTELTVEETVRHFATYYPAPRDPGEVMDRVGLAEKRKNRAVSPSGAGPLLHEGHHGVALSTRGLRMPTG